jgi:hypothetical protein
MSGTSALRAYRGIGDVCRGGGLTVPNGLILFPLNRLQIPSCVGDSHDNREVLQELVNPSTHT